MMDLLQRLGHRLHMLVALGRTRLVNDTGPVQTMQLTLTPLEVRDNTPRLAEYGFTSNPPAGADAALLFLGGDRSNGLVIATGHQTYRLKGLASGDAAIYDSRGQSVWLTPGGIVINGANLPITINNAPTVTLTNTQTLNVPNGDVVASGVSLVNHVHGGVIPGGADTGVPVK